MEFDNTSIVLRKTALETQSKLTSLNGVYDQYQKLVFLFDCSGSMSQMIASGYEDQYQWPEDKMAEIRKAAEEAWHQKDAAMNEPDENVRAANVFMLDPQVFILSQLCDSDGNALPDTELKREVIRHNLIGDFNIPVEWTKHTEKPPSRIGVVKKLAKSELEKRLKKYPTGQLTVIRFGSTAHPVYEESKDVAMLWKAVEQLDTNEGGTDILNALSLGMELCRKSPSQVNVHHFVLVTDGEDWNAGSAIIDWIPTLKASGIVLDYIHIGDSGKNEGIAQACKETGGNYALVNSEKALSEKFVEAVQRKCLPPSSK